MKPAFNFLIFSIGMIMFSGCGENDESTNTEGGITVDFPAAYVVNGGDGTISVIDLDQQEVAGTFILRDMNGELIAWPHHAYLSPDQSRLAIGVPAMDLSGGHGGHGGDMNGMILILNAVTGTTVAARDLPAMVHNAIFSPDGNEVWAALMEDDGTVLIFDAATLNPIDTVQVGMMPAEVTFSHDGHLAFVANGGSNSISIIDPATRAVIGTIGAGNNPVGAWPGADGNMYVDNEDGQSISVIPHDSIAVAETLDLGFTPGYAAFNSSRHELWVTNATDGKVVVFHEMGGSWMQMGEVATGADAHAIAFSIDGNTAYVTNQGAGTVSVINGATLTKTTDISVGNKPNGIVLRP